MWRGNKQQNLQIQSSVNTLLSALADRPTGNTHGNGG